ncbi:MAG: hypothetical protein RSE62_03450 [Citrobacter sp.]
MSAFQVSDQHITALLAAYNGAQYRGALLYTVETAKVIGQLLMDTNYHSVVATYEGRHQFDQCEYQVDLKEFQNRRTHIEQLKLLSCYLYNSDTAPGWKDSAAYGWASQLQNTIISRMEGWNTAAYSI